MRPEAAQVGARVMLGDSGLRSEWRGLRVTAKRGHPEYLALDVLLEGGRTQLFWHYELEETAEKTQAGCDDTQRRE